jgi:hypothetical protein
MTAPNKKRRSREVPQVNQWNCCVGAVFHASGEEGVITVTSPIEAGLEELLTGSYSATAVWLGN